MLTEKRILESLKKAKEKNLEIKIILEKNPYNAYNINNKSYDFLKNLNIEVVRSNPKNYALNHSKIIIIDEEVIIST
jgi:phosphatidylserine/phosphatidylglycerophosphate/cardiolipin synthase-like enzyme